MKRTIKKLKSGVEEMTIEFDEYHVRLIKSYPDIIFNDNIFSYPIIFIDLISKKTIEVGDFYINWDKDEDGGRIELKFKDSFGSEMIFIHYTPSDLKGMFDFIKRGFGI